MIRTVARFDWHQQLILRVVRRPGVLQIVARLVWLQADTAGNLEWLVRMARVPRAHERSAYGNDGGGPRDSALGRLGARRA